MKISQDEKTTARLRGTTPEIQATAQWMRDNMTEAEARLWEALRGRRLGALRFRAQHPVGRFVLDFYCPACKLAVEVDGPVHEFQHGRDEDRTTILNTYGYNLIRFSNDEVMTDLPSALARIRHAACLARPCENEAAPDEEAFSKQEVP